MAAERVRTKYGHTMLVDSRDDIGAAIVQRGIFDAKSIALMLRVCRLLRPKLVLDVGANIGNHALALSLHSDQVIAFEPEPSVFERLEHNIAANPGVNVRAYRIGLSDRDRSATLYVDHDQPGQSTLTVTQRLPRATTATISLRNGDAFLREHGHRGVGLIKVDAEGHDAEVLLGLRETLSEEQPVVVLEWLSDAVRRRFVEDDLFGTLFADWEVSAAGYRAGARDEVRSRPFGRLRWKARRRVGVARFRPEEDYDNILLVPPRLRGLSARLPRLSDL